MSDFNNGIKDGDVSEELEKLNAKVSELDSRLKSVLGTENISRKIIRKITEENAKLKTEIQFVSAQLESVCVMLTKSLSKLGENVSDIKANGVACTNVEDLASEVASRIVIPESSLDSDAMAEKVAKAVSANGPIDYESLGYAVARNIYIPQAVAEQFDYDTLAEKLAERLPRDRAEQSAAELDYAKLSALIAAAIAVPAAGARDIDYDELAAKIVSLLPECAKEGGSISDYETLGYEVAKHLVIPSAVAQDIDYDELAAKIAAVSPTECVSPDYIASKVAEQIIIPGYTAPEETEVVMDVDELVEKIVKGVKGSRTYERYVSNGEYVSGPVETVESEESVVTYEIPEESTTAIASAVTESITQKIDPAEIADAIAKQVGTIAPEQFEITVDDDGCDSLAKAIEDKIDYEALASAMAEKLGAYLAAAGFAGADVDTEELAVSIADKLSVNAAVNEDALAEKAAAILSNYLPEFDNADIADRVIAGVVPAIPSAPVVDIDGEEIADTVTERLLKNQEDSDFDIVIDEEGLSRISGVITDELSRQNEERDRQIDDKISSIKEEYNVRFDNIAGEIYELKQSGGERFDKLESNSDEIRQYTQSATAVDNTAGEELGREILTRTESVESDVSELKKAHEERADKLENDVAELAGANDARFNKVEGDIEEIKRLLLSGVVVAAAAGSETAAAEDTSYEESDEELVTVSDVVGEQEYSEDASAEEEAETSDALIDDIVLDENADYGEEQPEDANGGVDFVNMMKYNRSFISRIIQGTDEQKNYYGQVKTALLSYKKVNSSLAWGAERFNKGRETIARFKIRGKTLCLYLALNPNEFEKSVYHHADVSDNKSLHGTPMMVKVKSPLGVKKAIRLIDEMLSRRDGIKRNVAERDYAAMYPYETIDELIEDGLVKDVNKH